MDNQTEALTKHTGLVARELGLAVAQVAATAELFADGATVPFIARYRKERTGSLDEVAIAAIRDRLQQLDELDARRSAIGASLIERSLLTPELETALLGAATMAELEDIYLPYRPKRRTRATIAREKGLEPLALLLLEQRDDTVPETEAAAFVSAEKGVETPDEALGGARDIIAETASEHQQSRARMRELYMTKGQVSSKLADKEKETEGAKFRDYFEWSEPAAKAPSHRVLAMLRGQEEGFLSVTIAPPEEEAVGQLQAQFVKGASAAAEQVLLAVRDSYKRLLGPSIENEVRGEVKKRADQEAIRVFAENLRELLLASPLGQKRVLAVDPGIRTGCKIACLDAQGKLLHNDVIYLQQSAAQTALAEKKLRELCRVFETEAIAIGNGTAGRETEAFVRGLGLPESVAVVMVNESGASIYSASDVAREEFPDHDVTVRGAVSIGRRLMDPLAELVKIDPKSIGVGQYQHDVDQGALKHSLDDVVMSCVNAVGVEVNTASKPLLTYVSGLGPTLAANIVAHRDANGPFASRAELRKVPRLGPKAFEQCAGFLRIQDGKNPLDASAVHPESYAVVDRMAKDLGCGVADLMRSAELRARVDLAKYVTAEVGLPTLEDIMAELAKPGRDPREKFEAFSFTQGVSKIEDVKPGMKLKGVVTNVTAFGAFVDIGVHQDGLVHVSQLADAFVKDPAQVVKVQQKVDVTVLEVDLARKRISLSMKSGAPPAAKAAKAAAPAGEPRAKRPDHPRPARPQNRPAAKPEPKPAPKPDKPSWFLEAMNRAKQK